MNNKLGHIGNVYGTTECMCLYETLRYKHELYIIDSRMQIIKEQKYIGF